MQLHQLQAKQLERKCEQDEDRRREVLRSTALLYLWASWLGQQSQYYLSKASIGQLAVRSTDSSYSCWFGAEVDQGHAKITIKPARISMWCRLQTVAPYAADVCHRAGTNLIYLLAEIGRSSPYHLQPPHPDLRQNKHCKPAQKHIALAAAPSRTPILLPIPRARRLSRHRTAAPSIPADRAGWCAALKWPALRWGSRPASSASSRRLRAPAAFAAAGGSAWCSAFRISENCIEAQLRITSFPTVDQDSCQN